MYIYIYICKSYCSLSLCFFCDIRPGYIKLSDATVGQHKRTQVLNSWRGKPRIITFFHKAYLPDGKELHEMIVYENLSMPIQFDYLANIIYDQNKSKLTCHCILYFLENKLMRLYSKPASSYAPIFQ